ncbi:MAG: PD40 domain-containing protein, partial [Verrucomicrobiales bacterium]|nr:PD40 domain-containing protein [Verrucomicrobiales bacterium]
RARLAENRERALRQEAERNELAARQARDQARLQAYTSDMRSAASAVEASHFGRAIDLLKRHIPGPDELDLRGIEWRYLWKVAQGDEADTLQLSQFIKCARFARDGTWIAASTFGPEVLVIDPANRQIIARFNARSELDTYQNLDLSSDGHWLAIAALDGIQVRDTTQWKTLFTHGTRYDALAFSPDASRLACLATNRVEIFDTRSWTPLTTLTNDAPGVGCLAFAPDNRSLVVARRPNPVVEVWDTATPRRLASLENPALTTSIAISPDGRWLAAGNSEGDLRLWNWTTLQLVSTQKIHAGWAFSTAFSPDSRRLVSGGSDQVLRLWDTAQVSPTGLVHQATLRGHRNEVWTTAFSADGLRLISGGKDTTVKLWALPKTRELAHQLNTGGGSMALGFMPESTEFVVLASEEPSRLEIWNIARRAVTHTFPVEPHGAVVFNSPIAFLGTTSGVVQAWSLPSPLPLHQAAVSDGPVMALQVSADGSRGVVWNPRQSLASLWNLAPLERIADFPSLATAEAGPSWYKSQRLAFSPDGRWLAYAAEDFSIRLWNIPNRTEGPKLHGHLWHIQCLRFSPDSTQLASSSWDAQARLWNVATGLETVPPLLGHLTGVGSVSFSADGRTLATRGGDDTLRFWSTANGAEMLSLDGATVWFFDMLSKDGRAMAWEQGGFSGRLRIHDLPPLAEIDSRNP